MVWEVDRLARPSMGNVTVTGKMPDGFVVSQLVEAKATTNSKNNQVELEIKGMKFLADTEKSITKGEKLLLRVAETGNKLTFTVLKQPEQVSLNLVNKMLLAAVPKQNSLAPLINSLTEIIKSPEILTKAISEAQQSQQTPIRTNAENESRVVMHSVKQLIATLPDIKQINNEALRAEAVKNFIKSSGVFFEQKLATSSPTDKAQIVNNDVKANLVKINNELTRLIGASDKAPQTFPSHTTEIQHTTAKVDAILSQYLKAADTALQKPAQQAQTLTDPNLKIIPPPLPNFPLLTPGATVKKGGASLEGMLGMNKLLAEIKNQTESSLARLELSQSNLAAKDRPINLTLDIPILDDQGASIFHLRIKEDDKGSSKNKREIKQAGWTIELAFNIEPLGTINTRINLGSSKVSTTFWAENSSTAEVMTKHMPLLNAKLTSLGLEVDIINCFKGNPPQAPHIHNDGGLIDEKA